MKMNKEVGSRSITDTEADVARLADERRERQALRLGIVGRVVLIARAHEVKRFQNRDGSWTEVLVFRVFAPTGTVWCEVRGDELIAKVRTFAEGQVVTIAGRLVIQQLATTGRVYVTVRCSAVDDGVDG